MSSRTSTVTVAVLLAGLFATEHVEAQTRGQLKRQLKQREKDAGDDADKLHEAAVWAEEVGLSKEAAKLLESILKIDPDHAATRATLGFVQIEGEWLELEEAREKRLERLEKEFEDAGLEKVGDVWVADEHVEDAKAGKYWHDDERVSKEELIALQSGMVRHPKTGALIDDFDLPKAEEGLFPTAEGWVSRDRADELAAEGRHLWVIRSYNAWILGTQPYEELKSRAGKVDTAIEQSARLLGTETFPEPQFRPTVWFVSSTDEYNAITNDLGDGGSAYGACLSVPEAEQVTINDQPFGRLAIVNENKDWTPYWTTHGGGLAYTVGLGQSYGVELPRWFMRGVAGKVERHQNKGIAKFFGDQHLTKGGVGDLAGWFSDFKIDPSLDSRTVDYNVYQAGLLLDYASKSTNDGVKAAFARIRELLAAGPSDKRGAELTAAIRALQTALIADEDGVKAHFQQLLAG